MKMYAACLASYNNGRLHGQWFDLEEYDNKEDLLADIAEHVLRSSPYPNVSVKCPCCEGEEHALVPSAEEWAAHDWDGEGLSEFGEYPDLEKVLEHVRMVDEHGEAWVAYVGNVGQEWATEGGFSDSYMGTCESPEDWAREYVESTGMLSSLPENLHNYFDFAAFARDCGHDGTSFVWHNGTTYVFHG